MGISIDGASISGISIDGSPVREVTIDGAVVWTSAIYHETWASASLADYTESVTNQGGGTVDATIDTGDFVVDGASLYCRADNNGGSTSDNRITVTYDIPFTIPQNADFTVTLYWKQTYAGQSFNSYSRWNLTDGTDLIGIRHRGPDSGSPSSQGFQLIGSLQSGSPDVGSAYSGGDWGWTPMRLEYDHTNGQVRWYVNGNLTLSTSTSGTWSNPNNVVIQYMAFSEGGGDMRAKFDDIKIVQGIA